MQAIHLPGSGRSTTQLGYGCSTLMAALGMKESLRLLEAAYNAGIRHYDVAPLYGFGQAEGCVGQFRKRHGDVTVTTKYGIPPAKNPGLISMARRIVGPIVKKVPALKQRLSQAAGSVTAPAEAKSAFTAEDAKNSLERSLRELQAERIELWLLHEAEAGDLTDESLHHFLEDSVREGKIGAYGVASDRMKVPELLAKRPEYCGVVQCEWQIQGEDFAAGTAFRVFHRALRDNFLALRADFETDPAMCRRWSDAVGVDLSDSRKLSSLVLKAAMVSNSGAIVLVSAKNLEHLRQNAQVADDEALVAPALRLLALVCDEVAVQQATDPIEVGAL